MSTDTPTILKKIVARKHEEVAERSAHTSVADLQAQAAVQDACRGFAAAWPLISHRHPVQNHHL